MLSTGKKGKIIDIQGGFGVKQRLYEIGLTPNSEIYVVENRGTGPILISCKGVVIALGRGVARKIIVEVNDR